MRLWSLHPKYLDVKGLVALWREGLLAQAVLRGKTRGYARHPQLARFRESGAPVGFVAAYLRAVRAEALRRGYRFSGSKIGRGRVRGRMHVHREQLLFEWRHLLAKLKARDPRRYAQFALVQRPRAHPLFRVVPGAVAHWERGRLRAKTSSRRTSKRRKR